MPPFPQAKPDLLLVQGDTVTVMASSLAAFYQKVPVGHVEAGLRTEDRYNPFPEEMSRRQTSKLATSAFRSHSESCGQSRRGKHP